MLQFLVAPSMINLEWALSLIAAPPEQSNLSKSISRLYRIFSWSLVIDCIGFIHSGTLKYRVFNLKVNIFNRRLESLNFILFPCSITHFDPDISTFDDFTLGVLRSWANQLSGWALSQLHTVSSHCNMVIVLTNRTKFIWLKQ